MLIIIKKIRINEKTNAFLTHKKTRRIIPIMAIIS